jgi:Ca2+-binding EF-hand superfamily protein
MFIKYLAKLHLEKNCTVFMKQCSSNYWFLLQGIFERFDKDRSGKIDSNELRDALLSLGYAVSPVVLDLLVSKFDKTGGKNKAIEYDNFIE